MHVLYTHTQLWNTHITNAHIIVTCSCDLDCRFRKIREERKKKIQNVGQIAVKFFEQRNRLLLKMECASFCVNASFISTHLSLSLRFTLYFRRSLDDDISCWSTCMLLLSWFGAHCVRWTNRCGIELGTRWQTTHRDRCESTMVAM